MKLNFELKDFLDQKVEEYNQPSFIENDPISIPHEYGKRQDIEITGLISATLAWGQRKTIINKCHQLFDMMDNAPFDFIMNHGEDELKTFLSFKHRTFNSTDTLYFIHFLRKHYSTHDSLEDAFIGGMSDDSPNVGPGLNNFHQQFKSLPEFPQRTLKHVAAPDRKSACKRLNMFLRWMVRKDDRGVDFGLWSRLKPEQLVCPCDLHVERVSRRLGLIERKQVDWQTALELTENLKIMDPDDPVKYDYALFGLGVMEKF